MAKKTTAAAGATPGDGPRALDATAIDGGARMQRRLPKKQDLTEEKCEAFFAALAETCNVSLSARRAGFSANWAYRKRRTDAQFRGLWSAAVREGYAKLELVLLERAMKGTPKKVRAAGGGDEVIREYSNALAIALLRRHAETIDSLDDMPDEGESEALRTKIIEQLDRLREQAGEKAAKSGLETKNAAGRLALIRRMLAPTVWE